METTHHLAAKTIFGGMGNLGLAFVSLNPDWPEKRKVDIRGAGRLPNGYYLLITGMDFGQKHPHFFGFYLWNNFTLPAGGNILQTGPLTAQQHPGLRHLYIQGVPVTPKE